MTETKPVEKRDPKGLVDAYVGKLISRKLLVWGTATCALFCGLVPSSDWVAIALVYIGSQGLVDLAVAWKKAGIE